MGTWSDAGSAIRTAQEAFNETYSKLPQLLEQAFNGNPAMLGVSVGTMYALKGQAQSLMAMPDAPQLPGSCPGSCGTCSSVTVLRGDVIKCRACRQALEQLVTIDELRTRMPGPRARALPEDL
ncbi:hypothetical protein ABZ646_45280 [Streptomyces sp. NPDC007162]|uniref:hypothetical protein n=1 Tax=Streptomyces sp. NPDC007162 TaxID=3156917 RepID=UPI0033D9075F